MLKTLLQHKPADTSARRFEDEFAYSRTDGPKELGWLMHRLGFETFEEATFKRRDLAGANLDPVELVKTGVLRPLTKGAPEMESIPLSVDEVVKETLKGKKADSVDALKAAMELLSNVNAHPIGSKGRKGESRSSYFDACAKAIKPNCKMLPILSNFTTGNLEGNNFKKYLVFGIFDFCQNTGSTLNKEQSDAALRIYKSDPDCGHLLLEFVGDVSEDFFAYAIQAGCGLIEAKGDMDPGTFLKVAYRGLRAS